MYKIYETSGTEHYSNSIVSIRLALNGCYVPENDDPDGFTAKIPCEITREDQETGTTETIEAVQDMVFVLPRKTLKGDEPEATWDMLDDAAIVANDLDAALEEAYELLYGGEL